MSRILEMCKDKDGNDRVWRPNQMFYRAEYITIGKCWVVVGAYLGICFDVIFLGGSPPDVNKTGSIKKAFLRMLVCGLVSVPYVLVNKFVRLTPWTNSYAFE